MIFKIGDWIAFSYSSEPRQGVRGVKSSRERTQSGQTSWKEKKSITDIHDPYPTCIVLHDNWKGMVNCINTNNMSQHEINFLTAIIDPFFAQERTKTDARLKADLMRIPRDIQITSPHQFYLRIVKPFIHLYDGYRLFNPNKMLNIKVVKSYQDIQRRLKSPQKPATIDMKDKPSSVVDTSLQSGGGFFDRYVQSISRLRGPRFGK